MLQWSRIIALALHHAAAVPREPVDCAANNLGISELGAVAGGAGKPAGGGEIELRADIVVVCPYSARSRASTWQPDPVGRALALMPPDIASADREAGLLTAPPPPSARPLPGTAEAEPVDPLTRTVKRASAPAIIQFIEVDATHLLGSWQFGPPSVARPSISRFYFGFGAGRSPGPYLDSPKDCPALIELTRDRYGERLPPSFTRDTSFWGIMKFAFRQLWHWISRKLRWRSGEQNERVRPEV